MHSRRDFTKMALAAVPAWLGAKPDSKVHGVLIGAQSYSFRDRPLDDAIKGFLEVGLSECELWSGHIEPKTGRGKEEREKLRNWRTSVSLDEFKAVRRKFDTAGIRLYAYSFGFRDDMSDDELERGFQFAKALGVRCITSSSTLTTAKRLVPLVGKHKVLVGMHNHANIKDPNEFARPESFAEAMEMSKYYRVNLDIGHFVAAGYDPVRYIEQHHQRIVCLHIKDRKKDQGDNVPFGEGDTPIKEVLQLLKTRKYNIPANIEYEYKGQDAVAEVKRCFEYCRNALA